jgi:hypothetical protein
MTGGEWGFVACNNNGAIEPPLWFTMDFDRVRELLQIAQEQQGHLLVSKTQEHINYWQTTAPGQSFEHWRFQCGYSLGWSDAVAFFKMRSSGGGLGRQGGDKIGCLEIWILKRIADASQTGEFVWEFEQGFRQAVADFYVLVGV